MNCRSLGAAVPVLLKVLCILVLAAYIGSYAYLSGRGMREAKAYNSEGILYVPVEDVVKSHDLTRHQYLRMLFIPLNQIDQLVFGVDGPVVCMMFDLS